MSTKIFDAYRVKRGRFPGAARRKGYPSKPRGFFDIAEDLQSGAYARCRIAIHRMCQELCVEEMKKKGARLDYTTFLSIVREVRRKSAESYDTWSSGRFNMEAEISVRYYQGRLYVQSHTDPLGPFRGCLNSFLQQVPYLEDYHYQDSTDRPNSVSAREWKRRERVWDAIYKNDGRLRSVSIFHMDIRESVYIMDWWWRDGSYKALSPPGTPGGG